MNYNLYTKTRIAGPNNLHLRPLPSALHLNLFTVFHSRVSRAPGRCWFTPQRRICISMTTTAATSTLKLIYGGSMAWMLGRAWSRIRSLALLFQLRPRTGPSFQSRIKRQPGRTCFSDCLHPNVGCKSRAIVSVCSLFVGKSANYSATTGWTNSNISNVEAVEIVCVLKNCVVTRQENCGKITDLSQLSTPKFSWCKYFELQFKIKIRK